MNKQLKEFELLLCRYWDTAFAEGQEDRTHDTKDAIGQRTLNELRAMFKGNQIPPAPEAISMEPVATVSIDYFRGNKGMANTDFQLLADLPEGTHTLCSAEQLAQVQKNWNELVNAQIEITAQFQSQLTDMRQERDEALCLLTDHVKLQNKYYDERNTAQEQLTAKSEECANWEYAACLRDDENFGLNGMLQESKAECERWKKDATHWEQTCHDQWENYQGIVERLRGERDELLFAIQIAYPYLVQSDECALATCDGIVNTIAKIARSNGRQITEERK